jgi:hypothetical protein
VRLWNCITWICVIRVASVPGNRLKLSGTLMFYLL